MTQTDVDRFLMGSSSPSAKFPTPGTAVAGVITEPPAVQQQTDLDNNPKTFGNGDPMMQLIVAVKTGDRDPMIPDDDGVRRVFVKGQMLKATREAVRNAGRSLEVGGTFGVTYTGDGERTKPGFNPPKLYAVTYTPPAAAAVDALLAAPAAATPTLAEAAAANPNDPAIAALIAQLTQQQTPPS